MAQLSDLLNPAEVGTPANVDELKAEIAKLQQRLNDLECVQKEPVFMVEDYGPKSHALFGASSKLGKELAYHNTTRGRTLFSFNPSLNYEGSKRPGWIIRWKDAHKEVTDLLTSLGVTFVLQKSPSANNTKPLYVSPTFPQGWYAPGASVPAPTTVPPGWLPPGGTPSILSS